MFVGFFFFFFKLTSPSKEWRASHRLWSHTTWAQILALLLLSCVILSK